MSFPGNDAPVFLITAGPNGSGKSSAYEDTKIEWEGRTIWIINPDLLTRRLEDVEALVPPASNIEAVSRIERWLDLSIDVHKSIGVETVLSTIKYRRLVDRAKERGFAFWLIYVVLDSPERNVERVRLRVQKGGHDVPEEKIHSRYHRSLEQFPWFLERADRAWIFDNSGERPKLIGEKQNGIVELEEAAIKPVIDAVNTIRTA